MPSFTGATREMLGGRVRLVIFGDGAERPHIVSEISRLNIADHVTLHGAVAKPQEALAQIDLLVLPSMAEGFGLVLIEAMAAGVPVVATNVAGIRDVVVNGETGVLVPPGDAPGAAVTGPGGPAPSISRPGDRTGRALPTSLCSTWCPWDGWVRDGRCGDDRRNPGCGRSRTHP